MTKTERERRIQLLKKEVESRLPQMVELYKAQPKTVVFSQAAFALNFQDDEYRLLGMVVKYIGLMGKEIIIGGSAL